MSSQHSRVTESTSLCWHSLKWLAYSKYILSVCWVEPKMFHILKKKLQILHKVSTWSLSFPLIQDTGEHVGRHCDRKWGYKDKRTLAPFRLSFFREKIFKAVHSSSWIRSTAGKARLGRIEMKGDRDVTEQSTVERLPIESSLRVQENKSSVTWFQIPLETMNWQRWQGRRWKKLDSRSSRPGNSCGIWESETLAITGLYSATWQ